MKTRELVRGEEAVTAIEYAILASMVAMAIIAGVSALGASVQTLYNELVAALT